MPTFTTRVEMHGATGSDYDRLHELLAASGFKRTINGVDDNGAPHTYALPSAEYDSTSNETSKAVRERVKKLAGSIRQDPWVLVTEVADRSWVAPTVK